ncbi:MAG: hypothetical protein ACP5OO_06955 [Chloroflexia bacterium]
MRCEQVRRIILEETLEGKPVLDEGRLARHLEGCPACRAFLRRLDEVDTALRQLPLERAPAGVAQGVLERLPVPSSREELLPWTLWVPILSLLVGVCWAYLSLLLAYGPAQFGSFDTLVLNWLASLEQWVLENQGVLGAVSLSVSAGLLFTALAVALGFYVGRSRAAAGWP